MSGFSQTVSITTLGCKANFYDSSAIEDSLKKQGFRILSPAAAADVHIINTCTVTGKADCLSRRLIRSIKKKNPASLLIVTGCYAQTSSDEISSIKGVDYILGNPEKNLIIDCVKKGRPENGTMRVVGDYESGAPLSLRAEGAGLRTRANLKIQDGCNRTCSYCIIPKARGKSKSVPPEEILKEIEYLADRGFKEIVLCGIHLGSYGEDLTPCFTIVEILKAIEKKSFKCRFRISSLDPDEVTDELIELLKGSSTICRHLHLPLQSGSDKILKLMRRPYTADYFRERVEKLASSVDGISIGIDVIAGFPGEEDKDFEDSLNIIKELPVSYLHVFPYSKRKGTPASGYPGEVRRTVIKERVRAALLLDRVKREEFYKRSLGSRVSVIIESSRDKKNGLLKGRSSNYIPVFVEARDELKKKKVIVHLTEILAGQAGMLGRL